jgi:DNA-binding NarL/FixJ family response regulator
MTTRILLADDHVLFRDALRMTMANMPGIEVVGEASNGDQVLSLVAQTRADIVCMDINMPTLNGIEATRQLMLLYPKLKIIGLSSHVDMHMITKMMESGAMAYVEKSDAGRELLPAILAVSRNKLYLSPNLSLNDELIAILKARGAVH